MIHETELDSLVIGPGTTRRMVSLALQSLLEDPWSRVGDLVAVLAVDPAMEAEVIRRANSPEFRRRAGLVEDLATAVRILGFRRIGHLAEAWGQEGAVAA